VNVANPTEEIKIKDLISKIKKILNIKKKIRFEKVKNLSIYRRMPSIQKIRKLIKNKLIFTRFDKGLLTLKDYYENKN